VPRVTYGAVVSRGPARSLGERFGEALALLTTLTRQPMRRLSTLCADLNSERFLAREGIGSLIVIDMVRLAAVRANTSARVNPVPLRNPATWPARGSAYWGSLARRLCGRRSS